jgi:hypothetical protein
VVAGPLGRVEILPLLVADARIPKPQILISGDCCALGIEHRHIPGTPGIIEVTRMRLRRPEHFVHYKAVATMPVEDKPARQPIACVSLPWPHLLACTGDTKDDWVVAGFIIHAHINAVGTNGPVWFCIGVIREGRLPLTGSN